jgi:carbamoyltransferase
MSELIGVSGARRDACVALGGSTGVLAVCPQERVVRTRGVGVLAGGFDEALQAVLHTLGSELDPATRYVTAEAAVLPLLPAGSELTDHHEAHAALAAAELTEDRGLICVADSQHADEVTFWEHRDGALARNDRLTGSGFGAALRRAAAGLGFPPDGLMMFEALARTATPHADPRLRSLIHLNDGRVIVDDRLESMLQTLAKGGNGPDRRAALAASVQAHVADLLVTCLADARTPEVRQAALGGGLFYNTAVNTAIARSGLFDVVGVPVDPGNGGLAVGVLLRERGASGRPSPFLGPGADAHETKRVLDNCKLSYTYLADQDVMAETVETLRRGHLVGWFHGRMEWGRRALGHRSILANPFAPFMLENLNRFLKHRPAFVSYGLMVCEEDAPRYFSGPARSPHMQFDYEVLDPDALRDFLPVGARRIRVQTIAPGASWMRRLLKAFGDSGHAPVLVNTSFNAFSEPIVCTPRDAVRVFYGSGLDTLVLGNFVLRK